MLTRHDNVWTSGSYTAFRNMGQPPKRKTNIYEVLARADNFLLGRIRWYGRWRKYVFEPTDQTIYEETCLRDIAQFIEEETKAQRVKSKAAKA